MNDNGFYSRLRKLAKAEKWQEALALMRASDLSAMKGAFRTIRSGDGCFEMVFRFESMEKMHIADREWHDFRKATSYALMVEG